MALDNSVYVYNIILAQHNGTRGWPNLIWFNCIENVGYTWPKTSLTTTTIKQLYS